METTTQYPDWQKAIRAAQAAEEVRIQAQMDKEAAEKAEQDKKDAAALKFVLALAGIEAEPTEISWAKDGYDFWLVRKGSEQYGTTAYVNNGESVWFTLRINKRLPDNEFVSEFAKEYTVKRHSIVADWTPFQAWIAYALDELDSDYEAALKRQMITQTMPVGRREMTLEERLADVLRDFVLREIRPAAEGD